MWSSAGCAAALHLPDLTCVAQAQVSAFDLP
jgi:hypothetical protein